jgi:hypothetical protein
VDSNKSYLQACYFSDKCQKYPDFKPNFRAIPGFETFSLLAVNPGGQPHYLVPVTGRDPFVFFFKITHSCWPLTTIVARPPLLYKEPGSRRVTCTLSPSLKDDNGYKPARFSFLRLISIRKKSPAR